MLSAIIFLPAVGALAVAVFGRGMKQARAIALAFTTITLVLAFVLFAGFDLGNRSPQFVERFSWFPQLGIDYYLGVDGLSLPLVLLNAILGFCAVLASWHISLRPREYYLWLLILETSVMGVFSSQNLILFFIFWEIELAPMYFLISIWGSGRKEYSAMKYVIFTFLGSAVMLVGFLVVYFSTGTFDMVELAKTDIRPVLVSLPALFFLLIFAFMVKLPVWPLHTWLPDAHTDAPTAVSLMLAGVLLKMGGYGIIRIAVPFVPGVARDYAWLLAALAVVNVLYGAAVTMMQVDLKRLIAYSSVSHMGYVLLGVASMRQVGLTGASLQMFTHGTITGLLFLMVGLVYEKTHRRRIPDLGGLAPRMPLAAVVFIIAGLASLGLPSMSGFVSEMMVFLGTFPVWRVATILGAFGIVLTAGYILWMVQRVFFGPGVEKYEGVADASFVEAVPLAALVIAIVVVGVYPAIISDVFSAGIEPVVARLGF